MKSTIIILGLALITFNYGKANELLEQQVMQQELVSVNVNSNQQNDFHCSGLQVLNNPTVDNTGDTAVFDPESVLKVTSTKKVQEMITENQMVTEAQEEVYQPLCIEMTLLDKIHEDNQIIEGNISEEVYPLDFEKINRNAQCSKVDANNMALPVDIKL
jgi:hypothetical protein